jgi:hypothetical protein
MAQAQVSIHLDLGLPPTPRLVSIAPTVQVVEDFEDEVFLHNGWYWCHRPNGWYRARSPRAPFAWVDVRRVPRVLVRVPQGHYRRWHEGDRRHELRERERERREDRLERERERRERMRARRGERKHHDDK